MVKQTDAPATDERYDETPVTISFTVPVWVVRQRQMTTEEFADWLRISAALFQYSRGELGLTQAARVADLDIGEMMGALKNARIPNATFDDQDRATLDWLEQQRLGGAGE